MPNYFFKNKIKIYIYITDSKIKSLNTKTHHCTFTIIQIDNSSRICITDNKIKKFKYKNSSLYFHYYSGKQSKYCDICIINKSCTNKAIYMDMIPSNSRELNREIIKIIIE